MSKSVFGLLKFFSKKEYLEDFLNGVIYCNTPHFYRSNLSPGVGDPSETCLAFKSQKICSDLRFICDGVEESIKDGEELIAVVGDNRDDYWMHCWMGLECPKNESDLDKLRQDILRVASESGQFGVFIESKNIQEFINRIKLSVIEKNIVFNTSWISYTNLKTASNQMFSKDVDYSYQREFRIAIGVANKFEENSMVFDVGDLRDISNIDGYLYPSAFGNFEILFSSS